MVRIIRFRSVEELVRDSVTDYLQHSLVELFTIYQLHSYYFVDFTL